MATNLKVRVRFTSTLGKDVAQVVIDASGLRFRSTMLTAVSTVLWMIPIAATVFWGFDDFRGHGAAWSSQPLPLVFLATIYASWFGRESPTSVEAPRQSAGGM